MQKIKKGNIGGKAKYLIPIGVFVICIFAVLLSGNHFTSYQLPVEGYSSTCERCGKTAYYSDQYVYYPSTEGYSQTVSQGYVFSKSFILEDYISYSDMSRYYDSYYFYVIDKDTSQVLYSSGYPYNNFEPRLDAGSSSASESFSVTIDKSRVLQLVVFGIKPGTYGIGTEMVYNTGHRPTWAFFVNNIVPSNYSCGGNYNCPIGYYCSNGTCMPMNEVNDDPGAVVCGWGNPCATGYECLNGICQPTATPVQPYDDDYINGDSNPPSTPSVPDDSTSPVDDGSGDPADTTDGTSDTSTPTDVNKWENEGERYYAKITLPGDTLLETNKYRFETEDGTNKKIYFEGAGPDEAIYDYPSWIDPNSSRAITPSTLEEGIDGTTVGYEWDIDGDGTVDYTEKSFTHNYVLGPNEESRMVKVYFRVQMVDGDGNTFYTHADNLNFLLYKSLNMYALSCSEWSGQFAPIISEIMLFVCYFTKTLTFIPTFFIIGLVNIFSSLTEVLCVNSGMYPGWGEALALAIFGGFLLLMLMPDDIISAGFASVLAFVLGTTAPTIAVASVPFVAGVSSVAVAWGIGMAGTYSSLSIGPVGILLGLWLLALYQIFFKQGILTGVSQKSSSRSTTSKHGDKDAVTTITNTTTEVNVNVQGSKAMDGLRNVLADAVIVISIAMLLECKAGIPAYSGILSLLTAIPQMLMEFAKALGGVL